MGVCKSSPKPSDDAREELVQVEVPENIAAPQKPGDPAAEHDHAAKESELQWMNYMITVMWPFVRQAMIKKAGEKFQEKMHEELSKHPDVKIDDLNLDFDPGNKPPRITGLLVYQRTQQERNGLQVDVDFVWKPDSLFHISMTIKGHVKSFPIEAPGVGVSGMEVAGTMSCLMAPLLDVEPCVGTGQAFFLDTPQINMKVQGMKKLGAIGKYLTSLMENVVKNILSEGYILPHRFVQKVRKDLPLETMVTMKSPLPLGLLIIEVMEGKNLPASDTSITGKKSSDPFVEIKVGYGRVRSSTAENTLNPKWSDPPGHLFVYNVAQLVRITVNDDDALGADTLGTVVGYNVFSLMREQAVNKDGVWYSLVDGGKAAGQVKLRIRYFDIADIGQLTVPTAPPVKDAPPYLLTVKLLGLEAEDRGDLRNTRATVEVIHPATENKGKVDHEAHATNRLMAGFEGAMSWAKTKVKAVTGIEVGFGAREDGVPSKRKSGKAVLWGSQKQLEDSDHHVIPPMAIRAMEKLHIREKWPISKVAAMFQLDPEVVKTAVEMRGNFEVVWHEALHFLQPADNPFLGKVNISVQAPTSNQVRGADDHGFLGEFDIDLAIPAAGKIEADSEPWRRRIRQTLYRPKGKSSAKDNKEQATDVFQPKEAKEQSKYEEKPGQECTGIVIELMVELRRLEEQECQLDKGQTLKSKQALIQATTSGGVKMIPE
jgi:hypothetical protein